MNTQGDGRLTILMPTRNRPALVQRAIHYYISCGAPMPMLILDSSDADNTLPAGAPAIKHLRFDPSTPLYRKLLEGLDAVDTPYAVFWADDDFLVPRTLEECGGFLDAHPDYSAVHGQAGLFRIVSKDRPAISAVGPYLQTAVTGDTAAKRLKTWLSGGGTVFYSVQRTEKVAASIARCRDFGSGYHWGELAHGGLSIVQGKTAKLNLLYMLREVDPERNSFSGSGFRDHFDWVVGESFAAHYGKFCDLLGEAMAARDSIGIDEARSAVKQAFWNYLAGMLRHKWRDKYTERPALKGGLRDLAKSIPGSRGIWAQLSGWFPDDRLTLPALLSSRSPYHKDFMPIYRAVRDAGSDLPTEATARLR